MKNNYLLLLVSVIILVFVISFAFYSPNVVLGDHSQEHSGNQIENPFRSDEIGSSLINFLRFIINSIVLPIGTVIAVVFLIFSGFLFVTAQGNEEKLSKAKTGFLWTAVGVAVLLGAWAITEGLTATICSIGDVPGLCE